MVVYDLSMSVITNNTAECDEYLGHIRGRSVTLQTTSSLDERTPITGSILYPSRDVVLICNFHRHSRKNRITNDYLQNCSD